MVKRIALLWVVLIVVGGCASTSAPLRPDDPRFPTVSFLKEHDGVPLGESMLAAGPVATTSPSGVRPVLAVRSEQLWRYAMRYGGGGNDCPEGQLDSDCAHFQAHCLAAAGIRVDRPTAVCKVGLTLRVKDLAIAFDNASRRYDNVKKFTDYRLAQRGDYCFLPRAANGNVHDHLMLLAATPDAEGARVYSHTNNRNGNYVRFSTESCLFYRIEGR
jgi:hypothetical protein